MRDAAFEVASQRAHAARDALEHMRVDMLREQTRGDARVRPVSVRTRWRTRRQHSKMVFERAATGVIS